MADGNAPTIVSSPPADLQGTRGQDPGPRGVPAVDQDVPRQAAGTPTADLLQESNGGHAGLATDPSPVACSIVPPGLAVAARAPSGAVAAGWHGAHGARACGWLVATTMQD